LFVSFPAYQTDFPSRKVPGNDVQRHSMMVAKDNFRVSFSLGFISLSIPGCHIPSSLFLYTCHSPTGPPHNYASGAKAQPSPFVAHIIASTVSHNPLSPTQSVIRSVIRASLGHTKSDQTRPDETGLLSHYRRYQQDHNAEAKQLPVHGRSNLSTHINSPTYLIRIFPSPNPP
jgi:hypothetical protein